MLIFGVEKAFWKVVLGTSKRGEDKFACLCASPVAKEALGAIARGLGGTSTVSRAMPRVQLPLFVAVSDYI